MIENLLLKTTFFLSLGVGTGYALTLISFPLGNVILMVGVFAVLGFTAI